MTTTRERQADDARARHTVRVETRPWWHQGVCACRWRGPRRIMKSVAVLDALTHARDVGCELALPLISPARRTRGGQLP